MTPDDHEGPGQPPAVDAEPALTNVPVAPQVVGQALESLILYLGDDGIHHLHPIHSATLRLGWQADLQPGEVVVDAAARYGLAPFLVHSTSWRMEEGRVVLTYVVGVEPPEELNEFLADDLVGRSELARGDAMGPPVDIGVVQVVEHGLRHLAWLVKDDAAVHDALPNWVDALSAYEPEPFRAFGGSANG